MCLKILILISYLLIRTIISTPAILVSSALTDAHRPFLSVGRLITKRQTILASIPNPQQHVINTPSTMNLNISRLFEAFSDVFSVLVIMYG